MMTNNKFTIGFAYNMMPSGISEEERIYYLNNYEWDSEHTINRLTQALEKPGNRVIHLNAYKDDSKGYDIYNELDRLKNEIDIVFNFAEGGDSVNREAILPAMMEWLNIPHTGSDVQTLAIGLDKASTIEILRNYGVNTTPHYVFRDENDMKSIKRYARRLSKTFPLVVKPAASGTSIGMDQNSVVYDIEGLERAVAKMIDKYDQPAIIQEFLDGAEYAVGVLGNLVLPVMRMDLGKLPGSPKVRDPLVKEYEPQLFTGALEFGPEYRNLAMQAAVVHTAMGCRDYSRSDFRKNTEDGKDYFLEVNSLPGLDPKLSDYVHIAELAGIDYDTLVNTIVNQAINRYKIEPDFKDRFTDSRTGHIDEFIRPVMSSLHYHEDRLNDDNAYPQPIDSSSFKMVKAIKARIE